MKSTVVDESLSSTTTTVLFQKKPNFLQDLFNRMRNLQKSVNFASEASTMIWAYFSRHGDRCQSFSECINVDCSGIDMDFITLGVIVIAYINSVGLLLFSTIVSMSGWLLVWILLSTGGTLLSGIPVTNFAKRSACGVLSRAGGSAGYMGFCAIPTCMLVLGFWCFLLMLLGWDSGHWLCLLTALTVLDLRPIALRLSAMAMWVLHVSSILAVVALRPRASNFLTSSLSVRAWTRQNWTFCSFPHLLESYTFQQGLSDNLPVHLWSLQAWFAHPPIGIYYIFDTQYGPSEMLNDPGRILHSSW